MISASVDNLDVVTTELRGLSPDVQRRVVAALEIGTRDLAERLQAGLPRSLASSVRPIVRQGEQSVFAGVYIVGSHARQYINGFDGTIDVSAYTRMQMQAFGRPINPLEVDVRAYRRHAHAAPHSDLDPIMMGAPAELAALIDIAVTDGES